MITHENPVLSERKCEEQSNAQERNRKTTITTDSKEEDEWDYNVGNQEERK